jgi:hypothetical protein
MDQLSNFLFSWQNLVGAMIGALTPLVIWFFIRWYEEYQKYKEKLLYLEKVLVSYINNTAEVRENINSFLNSKVKGLISTIDENNRSKRATIGVAFLPLFSVSPIDDNLLSIHTKSGYLDNKLTRILQLSKDFALLIEDARCQFKETLRVNEVLVINKLNDPMAQNELLKSNLNSYFDTLSSQLNKNIEIYLKLLVEARVVLYKIRNKGIIRWHCKFSSNYRFFLNRNRFQNHKDMVWQRIDDYIKLDVDRDMKKIKII